MSNWFIRFRALFILLPLLSGCAAMIVEEGNPAATRESVTLDTMRFTDLAFNKASLVTIDGKSPTYTIDGKPERFAAFALPLDSSRRYLDFVSKPFGGITIHQLKTFVPVFTFFDKDRKQISTVGSGRMERRYSFTEGSNFDGRVDVPSEARYVVIHGTTQAPGPLLIYSDAGQVANSPASRLGVFVLALSNVGMATVRDSGQSEDSTKAQIFYVASIDGVRIPNAAVESRRASSGQGFNITTTFPSRLVPLRPLRVVLVATHATGAPIHAFASMLSGSFRSVEAELDFTPEIDKVYVVRGNLMAENPTVWIEDVATGQPVTKIGTASDRTRAK